MEYWQKKTTITKDALEREGRLGKQEKIQKINGNEEEERKLEFVEYLSQTSEKRYDNDMINKGDSRLLL